MLPCFLQFLHSVVTEREPGAPWWSKNFGLKNGLRYNFNFVTCLNFPFLNFSQCRKSKAISKAVFQAVFRAKIFASRSGPRATITRSKQRGRRLPNGPTFPLGCLCFDKVLVPLNVMMLNLKLRATPFGASGTAKQANLFLGSPTEWFFVNMLNWWQNFLHEMEVLSS